MTGCAAGSFPRAASGRQIRFAHQDVEAIIGACVYVPRGLSTRVGETIDPHGFFVYLLLDHEDVPVYVGQSRNIFTRLGVHMGPRNHRDLVKNVRLIKCADKLAMHHLESAFLREHKPTLNINGVSRD